MAVLAGLVFLGQADQAHAALMGGSIQGTALNNLNTVSTLAGSGTAGFLDGTGTAAGTYAAMMDASATVNRLTLGGGTGA